MTRVSSEMKEPLKPKKYFSGYLPYIKRHTPNCLLLRLYFMRVLLVCPNKMGYGPFLVDLTLAIRVAHEERAILLIIPQPHVSENFRNLEYTFLKSNLIRIYTVPTRFARIGVYTVNILRKLERLVSLVRKRHYPSPESLGFAGNYRRRLLAKEFPVHLRTDRQLEYIKILKELEIDPDNNIVTLYVRDSAVDDAEDVVEQKKLYRKKNRNVNLKTFELAIRYLIDHGYIVVRIGTISNQKLTKIDGFIDMTERPDLSQVAEPHFLFHSKFMIGTDSGTNHTAHLMNTPLLLTNDPHPLINFPIRKHDIQLLRPTSYVSSGLPFGIDDYLSPENLEGLSLWREDQMVDAEIFRRGINSAKQILYAVKEMERVLYEGLPQNSTQLEYSKKAHRLAKQFLSQPTRYPHASKTMRSWGPDNGFLGHGRISEVCFTPQFPDGSLPIS